MAVRPSSLARLGSSLRLPSPAPRSISRQLSTSSLRCSAAASQAVATSATAIDFDPPVTTSPRWAQTPPKMVSNRPFRLALTESKPWSVNESPEKLDAFYDSLLGPDGSKLLDEEVKWLAVTHKTFDHGRRGYNDRLAYLGRRIVLLQATLYQIESNAFRQAGAAARKLSDNIAPEDDRISFEHETLDGLENLPRYNQDLPIKQNLLRLADRHSLKDVLRWRPRNTDDMQQSGLPTILQESMLAIVGAIALTRGGDVAAKVVRERYFK